MNMKLKIWKMSQFEKKAKCKNLEKKVKCQNLETKGLMSKFGNKCQNDVWVYKSKYVLKISLISFFLRDSYRLSLISSILQKKKSN